jgi:hypothetical protein
MPTYVSVALGILSAAEAELRSVIERALADGRYDEVAMLAAITDELAEVRRLRADSVSSGNGAPTAAGPRTVVRPRTSGRPEMEHGARARHFPRFEREGDKIIKTASSRRQGHAEYEHRAPLRVIDALLAGIRGKKGEGAKFKAPDILPLIDPKTQNEIPSYQSYLALSWLRQEGVIVKHGRDMYSLKPTAATREHIADLVRALPTRGD